MPNWCNNFLKIEGEETDIKRFVKEAKLPPRKNGDKSDLSLNKLLPMPKDLLITSSSSPDEKTKKQQEINLEKYGFKDWYDWRLENWGIKWDIEASLQDRTSTRLEYYFSSPWGPPLEAMVRISLRYTRLTFEISYDEPGMAFEGRAVYESGITIEKEERDIVYGECPDCHETSYLTREGECTYCGAKVQLIMEEA